MDTSSCFVLGMLTRIHGIKGELVLFVDADEPERYAQLDTVLVETAGGLPPTSSPRSGLKEIGLSSGSRG